MKKLIALALVICMLITMASFPAIAADSEIRIVGASSNHPALVTNWGNSDVSNVFDGQDNADQIYNYYRANYKITPSGAKGTEPNSSNFNFTLEFEYPQNITEFYSSWGANHATGVVLWATNDLNGEWTEIADIAPTSQKTTLPVSYEGYYKYVNVELYSAKGGDNNPACLEVKFYGTQDPNANVDIQIEPAGATSHLPPDRTLYGTIEAVIDGSEAGNANFFRSTKTTTSTGTPGDEENFSFVVDLGGLYNITKFYSSWGSKYAKGIALWGSNDGVDFGTEPFAVLTPNSNPSTLKIEHEGYYQYIKVDAYSILDNNNIPACKEVAFYGTPSEDQPEKIPATYTVNYLDAEGNPVADSKTGEGFVGKNITETAKSITGYTVDKASETITLVDGTNTITFVYTARAVVGYVVKYVDANGNTIVAEKTGSGYAGDKVTENAVAVDGYMVDKSSDSITLDADAANNVITFTYIKITDENKNPYRVKIFTMGDSFTAGICEPNAFRYYIYEPLVQAGGAFEFIGPHTSGDWRVTDMYRNHGGVGGAVIGYKDDYKWNGSSWSTNAWSVTTKNGKTIASSGNKNSIHYRLFAGSDGTSNYTKTEYGNYVAQADIVTLYIGLNDYYSTGATGRSADIEFVKESYRVIVDRIFEINPDVSLYVVTLNDISGLRGYNTSSTDSDYANSLYKFNEWLLTGLVNEEAYKNYKLQAISLNQDGYKMDESVDTPSDEGHPNESGNKKIGTQIYMGIKDEVLELTEQGSAVVYNPIRVNSISIDKTSATLKLGENLTIGATIAPSNAEIISTVFSSSNEAVAIVDHYGRVTAVGAGTATIYATALDSMRPGETEIKAACTVTVTSDNFKKVDDDYCRVFSDRFILKSDWTGSTSYVSEDGLAYKHSGTTTSTITSTKTVELDYKFSMAFNVAVIGAEKQNVTSSNRNNYYTALTAGKYQLRVGINGKTVGFYYDGVLKAEKVFNTPVTRQNKDRYTLVKDGATVYVYRNNELLFTAAVDEYETVSGKVVLSCNGTNTQNVRDIEFKSTYGLKKLSPTVIYASTNTVSGKTNLPAANMLDNDLKTRYTVFTWKGTTPEAWDNANNYVILDLGDYYDVSNLDIYWGAQGGAWGNSMPDAYNVYYSTDNKTYTPALSYQGIIGILTGANQDNISDSDTTLLTKYQSGQSGNNRITFSYGNVKEAELGWTGVRYIKIEMTKIVHSPSIAEIEVFTTGYANGEEPDGATTYYTVKYVDNKGKEIHASKRVNDMMVGTEVTEQAIEIYGYTADLSSQTITLESSGNIITFTYTREYTTTPEAVVPVDVTTDMTVAAGTKPISAIIDGISKSAGAPDYNYFRSTNLPTGDGTTVLGNVVFDFGENTYYNLSEIWFNMGGCYMNQGKLYGSNITNDPNSPAWIELHSFDDLIFSAVDPSDGNKGQEHTCEIIHEGHYRYFKIEITGLTKSTGLVWLESTFMGCEGTNSDADRIAEYTVKYVDENGDSIASEKKAEAYIGQKATENAIEIDGYTAINESVTITLDSDKSKNIITITYKKNDGNQPVKIETIVGVTSPFTPKNNGWDKCRVEGVVDGVDSTGSWSNFFRASVTINSSGTKGNDSNFNFTVDLGYSYNITEFYSSWGVSHATKVALWGSNDNQTWTEIADLTISAQKSTSAVEHTGYYRYIKVEAYKTMNNDPACVEVYFKGTLEPEKPELPGLDADTVDTLGANIRLEKSGLSAGLRFAAEIDKALAGIEGTYAYSDDADVKFGMYLLPKNMLGSHSDLKTYVRKGQTKAIDVVAKKLMYQDENTIRYTAVLTEIPKDNWGQVIVALPYVVVDGQYTYFEEWEQSYKGVAKAARENDYSDERIASTQDATLKAELQAVADKLDDIIEFVPESKTVDLVIFMGQSNMAGYGGTASQAPVVPQGHGYWFKSISDPTKLYNITEPFGAGETNMDSGLGNCQRNGSMVSAFANAYYENTGVPIVAVFAAQGNTASEWWLPGQAPLNDAINRYKTAKEWLENDGYEIRNNFMVWCQGESDGWNGVSKATYKTRFTSIFNAMQAEGIDACLMVRIGEQQSSSTQFDQIIAAQNELCKEIDDVVMVCTATAGFVEEGLMSDNVHYSQEGYNKAGKLAGENAAYYVNNGKKPTMADPKFDNTYDPYN